VRSPRLLKLQADTDRLFSLTPTRGLDHPGAYGWAEWQTSWQIYETCVGTDKWDKNASFRAEP